MAVGDAGPGERAPVAVTALATATTLGYFETVGRETPIVAENSSMFRNFLLAMLDSGRCCQGCDGHAIIYARKQKPAIR